MIKHLLAIVCSLPLSAATYGGSYAGTLTSRPAVNYGFDFYYPAALSKPLSALHPGAKVKLQARFIWAGTMNEPVGTEQHAVVAFTQKGDSTYWRNASNELLWTHGAGAFVGEKGLSLELWFRNDRNQPGLHDDPPDAHSWDQFHNRCAYRVTVGATNNLCLSSSYDPNGYLTPTSFTLRKGIKYWVRVTLERHAANPAWAMLSADLVEETDTSATIVQSGAVNFLVDSIFPYANQAMEASVLRTPGPVGEDVTHFVAFDGGF